MSKFSKEGNWWDKPEARDPAAYAEWQPKELQDAAQELDKKFGQRNDRYIAVGLAVSKALEIHTTPSLQATTRSSPWLQTETYASWNNIKLIQYLNALENRLAIAEREGNQTKAHTAVQLRNVISNALFARPETIAPATYKDLSNQELVQFQAVLGALQEGYRQENNLPLIQKITTINSAVSDAMAERRVDYFTEAYARLTPIATNTGIDFYVLHNELEDIVHRDMQTMNTHEDSLWINHIKGKHFTELEKRVVAKEPKKRSSFLETNHEGKSIGETLQELALEGNNATPPVYYGLAREHYVQTANTESFNMQPCNVKKGEAFEKNGYQVVPFTVTFNQNSSPAAQAIIRGIVREEQTNRIGAATQHFIQESKDSLSLKELHELTAETAAYDLLHSTASAAGYSNRSWGRAGIYINPQQEKEALFALKQPMLECASDKDRETLVQYLNGEAGNNPIKTKVEELGKTVKDTFVSVKPDQTHMARLDINATGLGIQYATKLDQRIQTFPLSEERKTLDLNDKEKEMLKRSHLPNATRSGTKPADETISKKDALKILDGIKGSGFFTHRRHERELKKDVVERLKTEHADSKSIKKWQDNITARDVGTALSHIDQQKGEGRGR